MSKPTRRPINAMDAAEALFQPKKKVAAAPAFERPLVPNAKEMVSWPISRRTAPAGRTGSTTCFGPP